VGVWKVRGGREEGVKKGVSKGREEAWRRMAEAPVSSMREEEREVRKACWGRVGGPKVGGGGGVMGGEEKGSVARVGFTCYKRWGTGGRGWEKKEGAGWEWGTWGELKGHVRTTAVPLLVLLRLVDKPLTRAAARAEDGSGGS
jgi:hypothetical protein